MKAENVKNGSKKFITEFKEFISKGNVLDLAVGVIIGGAFTSIVNSLVNDIFMPVIGGILSGINFTDLKVVIPAALEGMSDVTICYGSFIQAVVNFLLTALVVFLFIKGKRMLLVDDVISTGESIHALEELVKSCGGMVAGRMAPLAEGDSINRSDIIVLGKLPLFNPDGTVKE